MVFDKVKEIIIDMIHCDADAVTMDADFESLSIDSLDATELCMTFEEEFNMTFAEDAMQGLHTISDIVEYIEKEIEA